MELSGTGKDDLKRRRIGQANFGNSFFFFVSSSDWQRDILSWATETPRSRKK